MQKRVVIILIAIATFILAERFGPGGRQRRGLKQMAEFRQQVEGQIAGDPRFANVEILGTTHPQLDFFGNVPDVSSLNDLRAIVQPPPGVEFSSRIRVTVVGAPATSQVSSEQGGVQE